MEKLKNRRSFFIFLILCAMLLLASLYYLKGILPTYANGFSSDIIAVLALVISVGFPLYEKLFPKNLLREYHVSPITLIHYSGHYIRLKIHIDNPGEIDINVQFLWIDFLNERFTLEETQDSRKKTIDNSILLPSRTQKDIYLSFESNDGSRSPTYTAYIKAGHKRDVRLIKNFRNFKANLTWSDVTPRSQQTEIPLGAWIIDYLKRYISSQPLIRT